ncbi:MAG: hypothetical protein R3B09_35555, partial [Nannocystaceae bacterium]
GELVIAGRFAGELGLVDPPLTSLGNDDAFLARLDPQGEVLWARSFGGKGDDLLHDLAVTDDGGVIGVGALGPSTLPIDLAPGLQVSTVSTAALLARFSTADGEGIWAMEALTNDPAGESIAANVALGKNGSIYVSGTFGPNDLDFGGKKITTKGTGGDFWLGRVDDETAKWVVGFGDDLIQSGRNIAYDQDLDRLHASLRFLGAPGLKGLSADDETPDVGVVGLKASDGVPNWSVQIFGEGDATAEGLDLDELGRIRFVADISDGAKVGDLDFPAAGGDFLTLTLAGDGAVLGARHFTGPSEQESEDIAAVPGGCAVVVGSFNGDLVEGPTTLLSAAADQDAFVLLLPP